MGSSALHRGMYFEEFAVGLKVTTARRTITETDLVNFAGLSGDFNQIHMDAEFAKTTVYGQRVVYGLCVLSIASGLTMQTGVLEGTVIGFREISEWKFTKPVFIGDTLHVEVEVLEAKAMPRLQAGLLTLQLTVKNQADEVVQRGKWSALLRSQPAAS